MGAREVMRRVRDGYRLERPSHCHPDLYKIISKCWAGDMNKRPDFTELRLVRLNFLIVMLEYCLFKHRRLGSGVKNLDFVYCPKIIGRWQ